MAASTFKIGFSMDFELRKYLTKNPAEHINKLMEQIEKYKRLENDQLQAWLKEKLVVGSQIVTHTLMETGNGPNKPNTMNL